MNTPQEIAATIKSFAKSKKVTIKQMLSECNLSINTLSSMQSGGYYPRLEAITRIAEYLDCSVDYLLGRTDHPQRESRPAALHEVTSAKEGTGAVRQEDAAFYGEFQKLQAQQKGTVRDMVHVMYERNKQVNPFGIPWSQLIERGGELKVSEPIILPKLRKED